MKHGGGTMIVWGCFSMEGIGTLFRLRCTMDAVYYQEIPESALIPHLEPMRAFYDGEVVFQQDNDPKHTAKSTKQWFVERDIEPMTWPSQSPDLNPIEQIWNKMEANMMTRRPTTMDQLWQTIQEIWKEFSPDDCRRLISTMKRRCRDVIKSSGGPTKW